jgi:hypothetical protein
MPGVCPVSRPRRTHARVRKRREPDAKTRKRYADDAENYWWDAVRLPKWWSAGLASCCSPLLSTAMGRELASGAGSGLDKALPHDSLTTKAELVE